MTYEVLERNREWKELQDAKAKLARSRTKFHQRSLEWEREEKERHARWQEQVNVALLEGEEPPPKPEPKPQPLGNPWLFDNEEERLKQQELALLRTLAPVIEKEAADRERAVFAEALPHIVALEKLASELSQLCRMVERVRRAVEGAGAPVRVYREGVDLATLAERARGSRSFLEIAAGPSEDLNYNISKSGGIGRAG